MPKKAAARPKLSRDESRDLDVEIGFFEGLVRRAPDYVDALQLLGDDYTRRGRYDEGLRIDQCLAGLCPEDPTVLYNLACSYALTRQTEQAASVLIRAIDHGYRDFKWLLRDPDLQPVRKSNHFKVVREKIRSAKPKRGKA